jgi:ATP-dependent helicase YprA (DUF1998 family)
MAINPVSFTEKVIRNFLRYQLTTYPFADPDLYAQMRKLLSLDETRHTPLYKGPYISLSRSFREGASIQSIVDEGILHPHMKNLVPFPNLFGHQERAIRSITSGNTTLISTGTGSGKTECFLYPIISKCLELRDSGSPAGISAVLVYPMNALAEDQLLRLRGLLAGSGITFGMYVGKTPEHDSGVTGQMLEQGSSSEDYNRALKKSQAEKRPEAVHPYEECCSRETMRTPGKQPRILLTNVKQLELLLTRGKDADLFRDALLDFLVFDEAHTFRGAQGAETACLIRRLRSFCGKGSDETVCVATSATIADPARGGAKAGAHFASRFFGVKPEDVTLVSEEYTPDIWSKNRTVPSEFPGSVSDHLSRILSCVDNEDTENPDLARAYKDATGATIDSSNWHENLFDHLSGNEIVYQLTEIVKRPMELSKVLEELKEKVGREVPEEEILAWLALGAAARKKDRPQLSLLRPVIHGFVRGVGGAMVSFEDSQERPKLWLSNEGETKLSRFPVLTCKTCGQHYFEHHVTDFEYTCDEPGGGEAYEDGHLWKSLSASNDGKRVILFDRVIGTEEEDEEEPARTNPVYLCRSCGSLHSYEVDICGGCGLAGSLVRLLAVQQKQDKKGYFASCVSCGARGNSMTGRYMEPIKPVKAISVADVHILAQDMVHHSERRRLLVFTDNRQDAAFQAGWMRDHARRFRLRALMSERIKTGPVSVGDLTAYMDDLLDKDESLSQSLIPEVWIVSRKEKAGQKHAEERKKYLRITILRELVTAMKQRYGLEPWGRMRVEYLRLDENSDFVKKWSATLGVSNGELMEGIAALLDQLRRTYHLLDRDNKIFSRYWNEGDFEISRGYLPKMQGVPKGLKLRVSGNDDKRRITSWISDRGRSGVQHTVKAWGIEKEIQNEFIEELWNYLVNDLKLIASVTLTGTKGNALPNCSGLFQIDADRLLLTPNKGLWVCNKCRRTQIRRTPHDLCTAYNCDGRLEYRDENPDNYDLAILDGKFEMMRPREHSAQVPSEEREIFERAFKSTKSSSINTLVCTPTLELGVDIGVLDVVLMRNVPPTPANYWQRVGRAGRRHRMAVDFTYCRPASHDRVYFDDPIKMLDGLVEPPSFNMRNQRMVDKHVHATVLTRLHQLKNDKNRRSQDDRNELNEVLVRIFPSTIKSYLFTENGHVRSDVFDVSSLTTICTKHQDNLLDYVKKAFHDNWPAEDNDVVTPEKLKECIVDMGIEMSEVVRRLRHRLNWAMEQINRLNEKRRVEGTLDSGDDALFQRCDNLIKRYKGELKKKRKEAAGHDDITTFNVLAAEGFLPGYGLDTGSVLGTAVPPASQWQVKEFTLSRPTSIAVREYVPGNLIYANNNRFVARYFHITAGDHQAGDSSGRPIYFQVDTVHQAIKEIGSSSSGNGGSPETASLCVETFRAIPICDVDLAHDSHITDEEDYRFQMPVAVYGYMQNRHNGGKAYQWGIKDIHLIRNLHIRLVNVGAAQSVDTGKTIGYPVCLVCGQSRSPFSSQREIENFTETHRERCQQEIEPTGFFADIVADALLMPWATNRDEAYSVLEALRIGASNILEMERDDLQILIMGSAGTEAVQAILYDPMPGGSGLLDQIILNFPAVYEAALNIVNNCPSACEKSCVDCMWTYRNAFFHRHLDRKLAAELLPNWGDTLVVSHDIPPILPDSSSESADMTVNECEERLKILLKNAGFPDPEWQHQITLGKPLNSTTPDCFYKGDDPEYEPGVCIYLDGLSKHIHGNPQTRQRDRAIREELKVKNYEVIEIAATELFDKDAMTRYFYRLGRILIGKEHSQLIKDNQDWYE